MWWDDAACYTEEEFVCEDSTELLTKYFLFDLNLEILKRKFNLFLGLVLTNRLSLDEVK